MKNYKVTSNKSKRHYTITINACTFKTTQLSKEEFEECEYNTMNDWIAYVKHNEVITIK